MKALTLTQPWASLVAAGVKTIETRSWSTSYRGPLAIHAASKIPTDVRRVILGHKVRGYPHTYGRGDGPILHALYNEGFVEAGAGGSVERRLPLGAVVAVCELVSTRRTETLDSDAFLEWDVRLNRPFGDFTPGRYAWMLRDIRPLDEPIPVKGALGLWDLGLDLAHQAVLDQGTDQ